MALNPWKWHQPGCPCCEDQANCYEYVACCLNGMEFEVSTDRDNQNGLTFSCVELTAVGPGGLFTADWSSGPGAIGPASAFHSSGNIIHKHRGYDASNLICPPSASDVILIEATFRNCNNQTVSNQVNGGDFWVNFWEGGDPTQLGTECRTSVVAPDGFGGSPPIIQLAPDAEQTLQWSLPLPMDCDDFCIDKTIVEGWPGFPPAPPVAGVPAGPGGLGDFFGSLQRICYKFSCRDSGGGAPFPTGSPLFRDECFGTSEAADCNQPPPPNEHDTAPLPCPDCYWLALSQEQGGINNPDPTTYGDDVDCRCGCKNCDPGEESQYNEPPRQNFDNQGNDVWQGTDRICMTQLIGRSVWESRTNDACFTDPEDTSSFGDPRGCYKAPGMPEL